MSLCQLDLQLHGFGLRISRSRSISSFFIGLRALARSEAPRLQALVQEFAQRRTALRNEMADGLLPAPFGVHDERDLLVGVAVRPVLRFGVTESVEEFLSATRGWFASLGAPLTPSHSAQSMIWHASETHWMLPWLIGFAGSSFWMHGLCSPPRAFHLPKIERVSFLRSVFAIAA